MQKIVTHSGSFDPDDVLAVAAVELYLAPEAVHVVRSREPEVIDAADWALDVGREYDVARNRFDHHQNGLTPRENGIPYSAFGLVWREYGAAICDSGEVAGQIEADLVQPIDAADNHLTVCHAGRHDLTPFELFDVIDTFKPVWGSEESYDAQFAEAVTFAKQLLRRLIAQNHGQLQMQETIRQQYEAEVEKAVLVFDQSIPRHAFVPYDEVQVAVCPVPAEDVDHWMAAVIPTQPRGFQNRVTFPGEWAGLVETDLAEKSGIDDAVFCHKERYVFVAESKEGALKAAHHARM